MSNVAEMIKQGNLTEGQYEEVKEAVANKKVILAVGSVESKKSNVIKGLIVDLKEELKDTEGLEDRLILVCPETERLMRECIKKDFLLCRFELVDGVSKIVKVEAVEK